MANPLLLGAVGVMAFGGVLMGAGAGVASASPKTASATVTAAYHCSIDGIPETLNISTTATAPASVAAGSTFSLTGWQTTTSIPVSLLTAIFSLDPTLTALEGTVTTADLNVSGGTPASYNAASTAFKFDVPVTKTQTTPALIVAPSPAISIGPFTAGSASSVTISPGNIDIKTSLAPVDCTAPAASSTDSFTIPVTGASTTTTTTAPGSSTPPAGTGEPWASSYYWLIIGLVGFAGLGLGGSSLVVARRRHHA
ncbi:MAG: hypothetical protein ACRD0Z_08645 [Acidimicrobiales bacterium]